MTVKKYSKVCTRCGGNGCSSCIGGVVYVRAPHRDHRAERGHRPKVADNKPHGNSDEAERAKIKLAPLGFLERRFPWEIGR